MKSVTTTKTDLETMRNRILAARDKLNKANKLHSHHQNTSQNLLERHKCLEKMLDKEVHDLEANGVRVNAFNKAILDWLNHSDFSL